MQNEIKTLIFDMDGTVVNSSGVITGSINYVRKQLGLKPMDRDILLKAVNDMHVHSPSFFYEVDEFEDKHIEWFHKYYSKNYAKDVKLYDGIRELLDKSFKRYNLSLATNAYRVSTMKILSHLDIEKYFNIVVCADNVKHSKPYPDMIYKILNFTNTKNSEALMIGDSLKDKEAASRAGVETILVDWGFSDLDDAVRDVKELEKLLLD